MKTILIILSLVVLGLHIAGCDKRGNQAQTDVIKIGVVAELTGDIPAVGVSCKNAAEMAVKAVNDAGGIDVAGKKYKVQLFMEDNAARADQSASAVQKLIEQRGVVAIIGPNASTGAIPASEIAEASKVTLITPWSTNPKTTLDSRTGKHKRYVFRACYLDTFQGQVLASFARDGLKAKTAAVLFDVAAEALKGQAEVFKGTFEQKGGRVTAYETYSTGDRDFSAQLTKIRRETPDVLFLPAYYSDVPLVVQQAHRLGLSMPFLGSDAWASSELTKLCASDCDGYFFSSHYLSESTSEVSQRFVKAYSELYKQPPDDVAALTYDAFGVLFQALGKVQKVDTESVRNALAATTQYAGVTGNIKYVEGSGDPIKGAVILQIKDGKFQWHSQANP
ncbi:MAG: ABC transporter substrate-binding protein [Nitrospirae bacterium]|nr:ABC transporter substrate-binding protein [Nitrospirota bacterium]MBF0590750.1 ABC transporter substrate-binding protein [Nitrospirota bacterium]